MHIFTGPQGIVALLIAGLVLLGAFGAYFAIRCAKASGEKRATAYSNVSRLENVFTKQGRRKENRCVFYIGVYLEKALNVYDETKIWHVYTEIKEILLNVFSGEGTGEIAPYEQRNFIALTRWDLNTANENIKKAYERIKVCLKKNEVFGTVDVKFGYFCAFSGNIGFDEAISRAKTACISAEDREKGHVEWHGDAELKKNIRMERNIEKEIEGNRFFLEYQPVVDAKTKKVVAAEVLSRLNSGEDGIVMPKDFLSAINTMSLNEKFDCYVFEKVCKWISNDKERRTSCVYTVNFSRTTLAGYEFAEIIDRIIAKYGVSYNNFAVEILEDKDVLGESVDQIKKNITILRNKGMTASIDDFGSGYTSFNDLQNLPIDTIKIDRKLVKNTNTSTGLAIFNNIVKTAKDIGVKTVCEGVETPEQAEIAIGAGCDMLQGFYYYKPMPVKQFEKLFEEQNS